MIMFFGGIDKVYFLDDIDDLIISAIKTYGSASAYTIYHHILNDYESFMRSTLLNRLDRLVEENIISNTIRKTPKYNLKLSALKDEYSWK